MFELVFHSVCLFIPVVELMLCLCLVVVHNFLDALSICLTLLLYLGLELVFHSACLFVPVVELILCLCLVFVHRFLVAHSVYLCLLLSLGL